MKKEIKVNESSNEEKQKRSSAKLRNQIEWIKRQLDYTHFSLDYSLSLELKKGEVYEIDWGINVNAEFSHRHFGVVLKDSNKNNPLVLVCPLKTKKKEPSQYSNVDLGHLDCLPTENETIAVVNQIKMIDKLRLYSRSVIGQENSIDDNPPVLDEEIVDLILTTYINYISGPKRKI